MAYPAVFQSLKGFLPELHLSNYPCILTEGISTAAQTLEYRVSILFSYFFKCIIEGRCNDSLFPGRYTSKQTFYCTHRAVRIDGSLICLFIHPSLTVRKTASNLELDITGCTYTAILVSYVTLKNFTHKGYIKQLATKNKVHQCRRVASLRQT